MARIIAEKKPPRAFLLENVKNLMSQDKGRTFSTIIDVLQNEIGYQINHKVINGKHFGPQHRERIIIVGFREPNDFDIHKVELPDFGEALKMGSVLHSQDGSETEDSLYIDGPKGKVLDKYTLSDKPWDYLQS